MHKIHQLSIRINRYSNVKYVIVFLILVVFLSCQKEEQPNVSPPQNVISFSPQTIQPPFPGDSSDSLIMDLNADGIDDLIWIVYSNYSNYGSASRTRVHGINGTHIANDTSFSFNGPAMYQRRVLSLPNGTPIDPSLDYRANQTMFTCFYEYDTIPLTSSSTWMDPTYLGDTIQIVGYSNTYGTFWMRSYNEYYSKVTVLNYGFSASQNFSVGEDPVIP